jgi:hypothetical protein
MQVEFAKKWPRIGTNEGQKAYLGTEEDPLASPIVYQY